VLIGDSIIVELQCPNRRLRAARLLRCGKARVADGRNALLQAGEITPAVSADATWKVQLNIENIFNRGYWASADANNNIWPGQPRTFRFKVTAKL
jgi:hypothetical protein